MKTETLQFKLHGKDRSWTFKHNLEDHGQTLLAAFENWIVRADKYRYSAFMEYVLSKRHLIPDLKIEKV